MVLETSCFYNQNEVMLNVTLTHYSTAFTDEIALRPPVNHQSHLYGSYALIMVLSEQPFTFQI